MRTEIIELLLKDRTTGRNIIWASDNYENTSPSDEIEYEYRPLIKSRVQKTIEVQKERTRKRAEVFTPSWICNLMNNLCDEEWFGRKDVFNIPTDDDRDWTPTKGKIEFSKENGWEKYVLSTRLEVCCGEAPYLVSRYDTTTGEFLPIEKRIGILDRKLRVVSENAESETEWFVWVRRAYESTYGYEFQGDNLLLARENLLFTFSDYYEEKFKKAPLFEMTKEIAEIVSWNIWQMNGLTDCVPIINGDVECLIKDWRTDTIIKFNTLKGESDESIIRGKNRKKIRKNKTV